MFFSSGIQFIPPSEGRVKEILAGHYGRQKKIYLNAPLISRENRGDEACDVTQESLLAEEDQRLEREFARATKITGAPLAEGIQDDIRIIFASGCRLEKIPIPDKEKELLMDLVEASHLEVGVYARDPDPRDRDVCEGVILLTRTFEDDETETYLYASWGGKQLDLQQLRDEAQAERIAQNRNDNAFLAVLGLAILAILVSLFLSPSGPMGWKLGAAAVCSLVAMCLYRRQRARTRRAFA